MFLPDLGDKRRISKGTCSRELFFSYEKILILLDLNPYKSGQGAQAKTLQQFQGEDIKVPSLFQTSQQIKESFPLFKN